MTPEHEEPETAAAPEPEAAQAIPPPAGEALPGKWKWVLGILIVALLAFPIIQRLRQPADAGNTAARGDATGADAKVQLSADLYNAGKFEDSIAAAKEAIALNPRAVLAYNNMSVDYLQLKKYDEALAAVQHALAIQPDLALAKGNQTWILNEQAKANGTAPAPTASTADSFLSLSQQKYNAGKFQECIDAAREALKLKPGMPEAYNNIAVANIQLGNYDVAIENAKLALASKPDYALAKGNLNWALSKKNEPRPAAK